jgi:[ribosomal protein S5]-alanine N-acetyltransferase
MQTNYTTQRLLLDELKLNDAEFIMELVNTPEWIKFIGERNINSKEEAITYIQKIISNPDINYRVVRIKEDKTPIGIITLIRRDYLEHHDIGFAFLASFGKKGYAYEAAATVLHDIIKDPAHAQVLATTIKENTNSIQLLEKLGFKFSNEIKRENEILLVYTVAAG